MNFNNVKLVLEQAAPDLRSIATALCEREHAAWAFCDAHGDVAVSATTEAPTGGRAPAAIAKGCSACRHKLSIILQDCLNSRQRRAGRCAQGHQVFAVPLVESDMLLGVLLARRTQAEGQASTAVLKSIEAAAHLAGRTVFRELESANLTEDLSLRYEELSLLYEIGERLPLQSSRSSILSYILSKAAEAVDSKCAVWVPQQGGSATTCVHDPPDGQCSSLADAAERVGLAIAQQEPVAAEPTVWSDLPERLGDIGGPLPYRRAMVVPVEAGGQRYGCLILLRSDQGAFLTGEVKLIASLARRSAVSMQNATLYSDLRDLFLNTIKTLVFVMEGKDPYTRGHSERVNRLALQLGDALGLSADQMETLNWASLLHDIGKLKIPESVLQKAGALSSRELAVIHCHPSYGAELLSTIQQLARCLPAIRHRGTH